MTSTGADGGAEGATATVCGGGCVGTGAGPNPAGGGRLGRRGVGRLPGVGRLNVIHRHVFNPALRATGGQRPDARECQARGPYVSIHEIKMLHIQ